MPVYCNLQSILSYNPHSNCGEYSSTPFLGEFKAFRQFSAIVHLINELIIITKACRIFKRLARYLIKTRTNGLILRPDFDNMLKVDCYVDTDFAGLWNVEDDQDPHCVKSRTGYVICVGGSPIVWSSKLQTLIASSTMESEYITMSTVCRELIPLCDLIKEVAEADGVSNEDIVDMHTTIWVGRQCWRSHTCKDGTTENDPKIKAYCCTLSLV